MTAFSLDESISSGSILIASFIVVMATLIIHKIRKNNEKKDLTVKDIIFYIGMVLLIIWGVNSIPAAMEQQLSSEKKSVNTATKLSVEDIKNKYPQLRYEEKRLIDVLWAEELWVATISSESKTFFIYSYIQDKYPHFIVANLQDIINTYRENSLKGDNLYKNKPIILFGRAEQVQKNSINDKPYLLLSANHFLSTARAEFKNWQAEADKISAIHTGQSVSLVCQNTEYSSGAFRSVYFFDCEFFESFIDREIKPEVYKWMYDSLTNPAKEKAEFVYSFLCATEQFTSTELDECAKSWKKCSKKSKVAFSKCSNLIKKGDVPKRYLELGFTKEMLKDKK